jgi:acetylornithine deacetylase/succinyl-diaminopimelate desuccinylase-like protein
MTAWKDRLINNSPRYIEELLEFLRIPSISSLPEHADDVGQAARWVAGRLGKAGAEQVQVLPTGNNGHPVVYGQWLHAVGAPTDTETATNAGAAYLYEITP